MLHKKLFLYPKARHLRPLVLRETKKKFSQGIIQNERTWTTFLDCRKGPGDFENWDIYLRRRPDIT